MAVKSSVVLRAIKTVQQQKILFWNLLGFYCP